MYDNGLFIFRRDLRIEDNTSLNEAIKQCKNVYPIFIFTPEQISDKNKFKSDSSIHFMLESLEDLEVNIQKHDGHLNFFYGDNISIIQELVKKLNIDCIYFNKDITPYAIQRDNDILKLCKKLKINCSFAVDDYYLSIPGSVKTGGGSPYQKFTPFYNKVLETIKVKNPEILKKFTFSNSHVGNIELNYIYNDFITINKNKIVKGGRIHALTLYNGLQNHKKYGDDRDSLQKRTTLLSAYLKFGNLSIREVFHKVKKLFGINHDLIKQFIWRDFYAQLLYCFPYVLGNALKDKYNMIEWENNGEYLEKWKQGKTGFPIVDAGMRELNKTGYMHNRARLITACFLIKTLLVDWREGEKYFATQLVDYDPASNNGNWQWVASTGADSQPYFRIFNPWSQQKTHDKDCIYIKKWIPELNTVPNKDIHKWNEEYSKYSTINYYTPIVDYKEQREKALDMYKKIL